MMNLTLNTQQAAGEGEAGGTAVSPGYDPQSGIWNDSLRGSYLWSNTNLGEAFPDVMTPLTWSQVQIYADVVFGNPLPGDHPLFGNIAGRLYMNLSLFKSIFTAFGMSRERMNYESEEFFGGVPDEIDIPEVPFSRIGVISRYIPYSAKAILQRRRALRDLPQFTADLPRLTAEIEGKIAAAESKAQLLPIWVEELEPAMREAYRMLQAGTSAYENAYRPLRRKLVDQAGEEDANLLLADVSEPGEQLASLGPLVGLWKVSRGELSREEYLRAYGHRGPHEMELSMPRPSEDPAWLEEQLQGLANENVAAMLAAREEERREAWRRYEQRTPAEAGKTAGELAKAARAARLRESIRSEETRLYGAIRTFALKAGELSGLGDGIFFLYNEELLDVLHGDETAVASIRQRREAHERLTALPPYPSLIIGRFDPFAWAADEKRRCDIYDERDAAGETAVARQAGPLSGYPGSAGVAEGRVRILRSSEEGHLLQPGEVLVASTTNVGWTPHFPRAAAVVTDIGAPLSHAAIVARELGIPAVVGTGRATTRLRTGDRVRVDGGRGTVELID